MSETSSIGEVLELAILREMQAMDFYVAMVERVDNAAVQAVLEQLAQAEFGHKTRLEFELMKKGMVAKAVNRLMEVDEASYTQELELGPGADLIEVLAVALEKERRAFRFYADLAGVMVASEVHEVILELAEEEVRHMIWLEAEYNKLMSPEEQ